MRKYNENPKNFLGLFLKPHQGSALDPLEGSQHPPNPQLIIAIAVWLFYWNSKKTDQLIFLISITGLITKSICRT